MSAGSQDLKQLKRFMNEHGIDRVQLAYFGTADPAHYGIDYDYLPSGNSPLPVPPQRPGHRRARWVALSAYPYQGVAFRRKTRYAYFHRYEPNALIGYSILVFDLDNLILRTR